MSIPDAQAHERAAKQEASSSANVTGSSTVESEVRDAGGYRGQSVMDGGDGGVAPPDNLVGERGVEIDARNAAKSDGNSLRGRAGVDVDTRGIASTPTTEAGVLENNEFHARDEAAAKANVVTDRTDTAERVYENPSASAEAEGRTRLRAEAADRKPEAATRAEEGAADVQEARATASNPEAAAANELREIADDKKANVQADVGVKVTTKKPDGT